MAGISSVFVGIKRQHTFGTAIDRVYVNNSNQNSEYSYRFSLTFLGDADLTTKTFSGNYSATVTPDISASMASLGESTLEMGYEWRSISSSSNPSFNSLPDCYAKITISNLYSRKLENGTHNYADVSIEATLLGRTSVDLYGNLVIMPYLPSQLLIKYSSKGVEIH